MKKQNRINKQINIRYTENFLNGRHKSYLVNNNIKCKRIKHSSVKAEIQRKDFLKSPTIQSTKDTPYYQRHKQIESDQWEKICDANSNQRELE